MAVQSKLPQTPDPFSLQLKNSCKKPKPQPVHVTNPRYPYSTSLIRRISSKRCNPTRPSTLQKKHSPPPFLSIITSILFYFIWHLFFNLILYLFFNILDPSQTQLFKSPPKPISFSHPHIQQNKNPLLSLTVAMATDEVSKPSPLPSYSEMILGAIEALDEKAGSNKSAISKYMESKYAEQLPEAHSSLLTAHLARMKESGEIVMVKNNYMKPGSDAPPKRGRGRPPKPKPPLPPGVELPSPRPRGRPPKPKDPLAAAVAKAASGLPRPRGRPPKKARPAGEAAEGCGAASPAPPSAGASGTPGVKRGRGRPPKVKPPYADVGFA